MPCNINRISFVSNKQKTPPFFCFYEFATDSNETSHIFSKFGMKTQAVWFIFSLNEKHLKSVTSFISSGKG